MNRSVYISLLILLAVIYLTYQYSSFLAEEGEKLDDEAEYRKENPDEFQSRLEICRTSHPSDNVSYRGESLISKSTDDADLVICPGDTFGDLNGTYAILEDCYLRMYHQGRLIWSSSPKNDDFGGSEFLCVLTFQKDGVLTLWKEGWQCFGGEFSALIMHFLWGSNTASHPIHTELRIRNQQLQLVQTFQDKTQRLFYAGESSREFREDLGEPKQIAKEFLLINHIDASQVILKRNEYIGDLNGMHLIFQSNCELQLKNKSQAIWSFAAYFKPDDKRCDLRIQGNSIRIPELPIQSDQYYYQYKGMNILPPNDFLILQSNITFSGDQLLIIQTLKNGSEIIFYNEPGQDNGLKLKREPRQIAKNNIMISHLSTIERLDYIGDLDGLHLILHDNCSFTLANNQEKLWKLAQHVEPDERRIINFDGPFMECRIQFKEDGTIVLNKLKNNNEWDPKIQVFRETSYDHPYRFQIFLENNLMIMTLESRTKPPKIYHAGANTNGTWLQFISNSSVIINAKDTADEILPTMGYIGDIHGVFTTLNRRGNWVLFNKTRVIWESETTQDFEAIYFDLVSTRDGAIAINWGNWWKRMEEWSTSPQTVSLLPKAEFSKTELLVNNDGMWLINTFIDGTIDKYKALEGTNRFVLIPNESEFINT